MRILTASPAFLYRERKQTQGERGKTNERPLDWREERFIRNETKKKTIKTTNYQHLFVLCVCVFFFAFLIAHITYLFSIAYAT